MSLAHRLYTSTGMVSYAQNIQDSILIPQTGEALALGGYTLANRSGAAVDVGLYWRQPNALWKAGTIDASATPDYTDDTASAQSTTANAFVNVFTTTDADGFLVASKTKFHAIGFKVDDVGAAATLAYTYYNGTSMATLPTIETPNIAASGWQYLTFTPPQDWVVNTTTAVTGPSNHFAIQITGATAPSSVTSISDVRLFTMIDFYPQLASNAEITSSFNGNELQLPVGASVVPYFGGTASNANAIWCDYRSMSRQV